MASNDPQPGHPPQPSRGPTSVHQLLIHGVSGTTPQAMLSRDGEVKVTRFASFTDRLTGLYRAEDQSVEAYSWGGLTSGTGQALERLKRVGWLSLLPFALVNVAYWTRPEAEFAHSPSRRATAIALRWAGLLLTMGFIGTICLISMDLVAWQCFRGGGLSCDPPGMLHRLEFLASPAFNAPSRRLLVGAALPALALMALLALSYQSAHRYEAVPDSRSPGGQRASTSDPPTPGARHLDGDEIVLRRGKMWSGQDRVRSQRPLHVVVGLCVIVLYATLPMAADLPPADAPGAGWGPAIARLAVVASVAALVLALAAAAGSVREGNDFFGPAATRWNFLRRAAGCAAGIATAALIWGNGFLLTDLDVDEARSLYGDNLFIGLDFAALGAVVAFLVFASRSLWAGAGGCTAYLLLLAAGYGLGQADGPRDDPLVATAAAVFLGLYMVAIMRQLHRNTARSGQAWGGAAPAVMLGAAIWVALVFSVVVAVGAADLLNGSAPVTAIEAEYEESRSVTEPILSEEPMGGWDLRAPGQVVVIDAVVVEDAADDLLVLSGQIQAPSLHIDLDGIDRQVPGFTVHRANLALDAPVALVNSCVLPQALDAAPATCQDGRFVVDGSIALAAGDALRIDASQMGGVQLVVAEPPQETLVLPSVLLWVASMLPLWLTAALAWMVVSWLRFARVMRRPIRQQLQRDRVSRQEQDRCAGPRTQAAFVRRAEPLVGRLSILTVVAAILCAMGAVNGEAPWDRFAWARLFGDFGLLFAVAAGGGLVWFASKVRTSETSRRQAGVLWDIATFWPRVAHPLGPPCYGERVVPEVTRRVRELVSSGDEGPVVVSGHSQGSVIAVAVLSRLEEHELARVRLVTYGSQLSAWFGRLFPAVLGPAYLGTVSTTYPRPLLSNPGDLPLEVSPASEVRQDSDPSYPTLRQRVYWVNLFRRTDPIGFPLFEPKPVWRMFPPEPDSRGASVPELPDVRVIEIDDRGDVQTHSGYQFTREYGEVVAALLPSPTNQSRTPHEITSARKVRSSRSRKFRSTR